MIHAVDFDDEVEARAVKIYNEISDAVLPAYAMTGLLVSDQVPYAFFRRDHVDVRLASAPADRGGCGG